MPSTSTRTSFLVRCFVVLAVLALIAAALPVSTAQAGSFISKTYNGRTYKVFIPAGYQPGTAIPVVVMLHGCTQDPDQFAAGTEMNAYAEQHTFIVVYPDQPTASHSNKCWRWFDPAHQSRGSGEPAAIAGIVGQVKVDYTVDANRVYVAGMSAGGAMAVIMGATYPDVFASIGVGSGLEYKAATSESTAWSVMSSGGPDPVTQGNAAYTAMGSYRRTVPAIVFHGASDYTVNVTNGHQVLSQWAQTNDRASDGTDNNNIDDTPEATTPGSVPGGRTYTQYVYRDQNGVTVMEKTIVDGMGHAWSGGSTAGSYTDPQGPEASLMMWQFFVAHPKSGGAPSPTATPVPTQGPTPTPTTPPPPTATPSTNSMTFGSTAAEDGFAGALLVDGSSTTTHKLGDKGMYNTDTYRVILSFNTSGLPDGAILSGARLRITRSGLTGTVSSIQIDIRSGYFGTSSGLVQTDYSAAASASNIAVLSVPGANNGSSEVALPSSALAYINKTGLTQFRLRGITTANYASDVLTIYGGENTTYRPVLIVTYN